MLLDEIVLQKNTRALLQAHYKNKNGALIKKEKNKSIAYDPRTRPWYIGAVNAENRYWIGVYEFYTTKKLGITIAFPIWINNKLAGVAAADVNIDLITQQLKNYSLSNRGNVFIINNRQDVISYEKIYVLAKHLVACQKCDLGDPLINTAYALHQQQNKTIYSLRMAPTYIATFTPYAFSPSEKWEIVTILPIDVL